MAFNIQEMLLGALQGSAQAQNAAGKESDTLTSVLESLRSLNTQTGTAIDTKTSSISTVEDTALKGAQVAQDSTRKFAAAAGSDISSPSDILVSLGEQLRGNIEAANKAQSAIQAKESARIIDDPLGWLQGQLTLQDDYAKYNQHADQANIASNAISTLTRATDEVGKTQEGLAVKVTDASRAAAAQARIAQGVLEKQVAERGHLKDEMAVAGAIAQNSAAQAAETQRQFNMVVSAEGLEMERQRFEFSKQQFDWEKQIKTAALKEKSTQEATKAELLKQYNIGASALGLPIESNFDLVLARAELGGAGKDAVSAAMEAGFNSVSAGRVKAAGTPAGAAQMISGRLYPRANDPAFSPMKQYLQEHWDLALINQGGKKDKAVIEMNTSVAAAVKRFEGNTVAIGSFYAPPPIASITATKSVQQTALYQKVLATAGKDLTTAAPTPIIELAYAAAKKGTISFEEAAAGLSEMYGQAANINNLTKRYDQVGIPSQTSFKIKPEVTGGKEVNLMDYSSNLRMLALMKAKERIGQATAGSLGMPFGQLLGPAVVFTKQQLEGDK